MIDMPNGKSRDLGSSLPQVSCVILGKLLGALSCKVMNTLAPVQQSPGSKSMGQRSKLSINALLHLEQNALSPEGKSPKSFSVSVCSVCEMETIMPI